LVVGSVAYETDTADVRTFTRITTVVVVVLVVAAAAAAADIAVAIVTVDAASTARTVAIVPVHLAVLVLLHMAQCKSLFTNYW